MQIAFDGIAFQGSGGVGTYAFNLIRYLAEIDKMNKYFILVNSLRGDIPKLPDFKNSNFQTLLSRYPNRFEATSILGSYRIAYPYLLRKEKVDIFHGLFSRAAFYKKTKTIVTLHDIAPIIFPELFEKIVLKIRKRAICNSINANKIIVDSNCTKNDLIRIFKIKEEKIKVIYLGVENKFRPVERQEAKNYLKDKFGITKNFILHIGVFLKSKNHMNLLKAYKNLIITQKRDEELVLVGGGMAYRFKEFCSFAEELGIRKNVRFLGHVSEEDLPFLYSAASLFVFPSWYEGFGLPVLEAMACGTPVVSSNRGSLSEIVGNAAILVDPGDINALGDAMYTAIDNNKLRKNLIDKGLCRSKLFSWENTAKETVKLYQEVYDS